MLKFLPDGGSLRTDDHVVLNNKRKIATEDERTKVQQYAYTPKLYNNVFVNNLMFRKPETAVKKINNKQN